MPSSPQTVSTVLLFDYEIGVDGKPLVKAAVEVSLQYDQATLASPAVMLESVKQTTTTDSNGYWQVALVQNSAISPANTVYLVRTPFRSFQVSIPAGAGPFQASANMANALSTLSPAVTNLVGPLTLASGPLVVGSGGASITGNETVTGTFFAGSPITFGTLGGTIDENTGAGQIRLFTLTSGKTLWLSAPGGLQLNAATQVLGHITTVGTVPTIDLVNGSITINSIGGTDTAGTVNFTVSGASVPAQTVLMRVNYAVAYVVVPVVILSAMSDTGTNQANGTVSPVAMLVGSFQVISPNVMTTLHTYSFSYNVFGKQ